MKRKDKIVKGITATAGVLLFLSGMCFDSESNIPMIVGMVCALWLLLFLAANWG